ncbi:MAG: phosphonopyruvate decarboxylase [Treponema sp.]|jgi:phosphonopyruvate decarboxylase|nr:phosphonopyruvate decarboxylase [Treponema sp.]
MVEPQFFYNLLTEKGTGFFTGVPDSLLKSFCAYITDHAGERNHIIAVNEGAAVALAAGYHLATGKPPLVYMQNSGIGNAVNPLLSLADPEVYQIPLILLIGWRGEPGVKDEPQHIKQGRVTGALLGAMEIPYVLMADTEDILKGQVERCYAYMAEKKAPYAFVVPKDTFGPYTLQQAGGPGAELSREEAIEEIIKASGPEEFFFSTTGMASRELYELREKLGLGHERDFLTVGSMGHASQIALSAALQRPELSVTCLDGDGALLMHMGALGTIGTSRAGNFRHIVLNNGAHDSVGGQPTVGLQIAIPDMARACGYAQAYSVKTRDELGALLAAKHQGPLLIEVRVRRGARKDLGRPRSSPRENKTALMKELL